jgi:dUTP pyrophosphatase
MLIIDYKKISESAVEPTYSREGDACVDITAISRTITDKYVSYKTGLKIKIPKGYIGDLRPRSSISNYDLVMCNAPGTIDSNFIGELEVRFFILNKEYNAQLSLFDDSNYEIALPKLYEIGDRVAQFVAYPIPELKFNQLKEDETLGETARGEQGFGSTGR